MKELFTDPYQIAKYIKDAKKQTLVKVFLNGDISNVDFKEAQVFGSNNSYVVIGNYDDIKDGLSSFNEGDYFLENTARNSAVPSLDLTKINARIEPGAFIRDHVTIGNNAVVMMGAIINIGATIGDESMIDMNAVLGARATIGNRVHVGAGSVIAGVLEPPSATPVIIEDDVLIGANAVVLEGVRVGANSVVAAGSVVINDVPPGMIVAGSPAKIIKETKDLDQSKKELLDDLRK